MRTDIQARIDPAMTPKSRGRRNGKAIVTSFWDLLRTIRDVSPEGRDDLVIDVIADLIKSGKVRVMGPSGTRIRRLRLDWS